MIRDKKESKKMENSFLANDICCDLGSNCDKSNGALLEKLCHFLIWYEARPEERGLIKTPNQVNFSY